MLQLPSQNGTGQLKKGIWSNSNQGQAIDWINEPPGHKAYCGRDYGEDCQQGQDGADHFLSFAIASLGYILG